MLTKSKVCQVHLLNQEYASYLPVTVHFWEEITRDQKRHLTFTSSIKHSTNKMAIQSHYKPIGPIRL